ncbi:MAG: hypothetical protein U0X20_17425 [Caldilineaceae bacterium]
MLAVVLALVATIVDISIGVRGAAAQSEACNVVITNMQQAFSACSDVNSNWACYASNLAEAKPVKYRFHRPRDRRPLSLLDEIRTRNEEGVVILNLQPVDQLNSIKAVMVGRVGLEAKDAHKPIYTLSVEGDRLLCTGTPPGMAIRTESGRRGQIVLNGVQIDLQSVAYVTLTPDGLMTIVNLEGHVDVTVAGDRRALAVGEQVQVTFSSGSPRFFDEPAHSPLAASPVLQWLASDGLPSIRNTNETIQACSDTIAFGTAVTGRNVDPGQECLFNFCAAAGDRLSLAMNAVVPSLDPWLDLRGPDGDLLAFNNDNNAEDHNSSLCDVVAPVTSCGYTAVARAAYNATAGAFSLQLARDAACQPPVPRCEVVTPLGTNLRAGSAWSAAPIRVLPAATHMEPLELSKDKRWIHVRVETTGEEGWVYFDAYNVECEANLTPSDKLLPQCPEFGLPCGDHPATTSSAVLSAAPAGGDLAGAGGLLGFGFALAAGLAAAVVAVVRNDPDDPSSGSGA